MVQAGKGLFQKRKKNPLNEGKFFIQRDLINKGESKKFGKLGMFFKKPA